MGCTGVDQLTGGGQYPHQDCGEACVVSLKVDDGKADNTKLEEQFDLLHGDNPDDGTGGEVHVQSLAAVGIPAHVDRHNTADVLAHARLSGLNRVMVVIESDHAGYPSPGSGLGHWLLWCGGDCYMQPVGGHLVNYPDDIVEAASKNYHVVVDRLIGVKQEDDMATIGQKRATIFTFRVSAFGEWPPDQASVDTYAARIADDYSNVEDVLTNLRNEYEANGGKSLWKGTH